VFAPLLSVENNLDTNSVYLGETSPLLFRWRGGRREGERVSGGEIWRGTTGVTRSQFFPKFEEQASFDQHRSPKQDSIRFPMT
jgi:hypothetical protein